MPEMLRGIHAIVGTLMYAENFFIVLHDAERDTPALPVLRRRARIPRRRSARSPLRRDRAHADLVPVRDGKPLMGSTEELRSRCPGRCTSSAPTASTGSACRCCARAGCYGALVVQSYEPGIGLHRRRRPLLEFVASHILTALERKQGKEELEQRSSCARCELAEANRGLQLEIVERQRAERLQAALFQIAAAGHRGHQPGASSTGACTRWSAS